MIFTFCCPEYSGGVISYIHDLYYNPFNLPRACCALAAMGDISTDTWRMCWGWLLFTLLIQCSGNQSRKIMQAGMPVLDFNERKP